jgi:RNA polymerase sigma-70 factor (ECF subfamily)
MGMNAPMEARDAARLTDAELVEHARSGNTRALEAIMRRNNRALFRTARAILRDDAEAEDAVQEAYLRAFAALGEFRGESKLSTWLVRIAANEALMRRRSSARRAAVLPMRSEGERPLEEEAMSLDPGPELDAQCTEMRRLLERRIDALPDDYRAVFVLRALEELTVEETAAALGIPEATVRTRHFRARALLRESLAQEIDRNLEDAFSFAGARCDRVVAKVLERIAAGT